MRGRRENPLVKAFISAGEEAGYHRVGDYNGYQQEGFGPYDMNVYKGQRWSAAKAYLRPALKLSNCGIIRALALKININNGCAKGVEVLHNGAKKLLKANKEVILAASSINSPKLLMLSGIGPAAHLREHGIDVVVDRPGVGKNLQDHLEVYMQMAASKPVSLFKYWNFWGKAYVGARWLLTKTGPGSTNQFESAGFIRSDKGIEYPDIQYHFLPIAVSYDGKAISEGHGFQAHVGPMRSPSRGKITLKSKDPVVPPKIQFNYMSTEKDWKDFRKCIRLTREIFSQDAFKPYSKHEIQPGSYINSDEEIDGFIKNEAESAYHPCGTCKMGSETDKNSVVNWETKVIGVKNLRVADSSIFPRITNGNLNAPSIMTGEKAADHILGKSLLSASNSKTWINPNWKTSQR
jgi:choline dehydrogenase